MVFYYTTTDLNSLKASIIERSPTLLKKKGIFHILGPVW